MHRGAVRVIFGLLVVAMPVQEAVRERFAEPFPALLMPSFGAAPSRGDTITYTDETVVARYGDGTEKVFTAREILPDAQVLPAAVLDFGFRDDRRATDEDTVDWLAERIDRAGGRGPADEAEVRWVEVVHHLDGSEPTSTAKRHVVLDLLHAEGGR